MDIPETDAEELVQDVLMKVHSNLGKFRRDGRAKLTTWIFQIAENHAVDFHRARHEEFQELPENYEPVRWHGQFAGRNTDLLEWLVEELAKVSPENRQILLWHAQDFSFAEIGRWLGLEEGTARVRNFRATKKLEVAGKQVPTLMSSIGQDIPESEGRA